MDDIIFMMAKEYCGGNIGALSFCFGMIAVIGILKEQYI